MKKRVEWMIFCKQRCKTLNKNINEKVNCIYCLQNIIHLTLFFLVGIKCNNIIKLYGVCNIYNVLHLYIKLYINVFTLF